MLLEVRTWVGQTGDSRARCAEETWCGLEVVASSEREGHSTGIVRLTLFVMWKYYFM